MGKLQAGMARAVITPPVGTQLSGYGGRTSPSIGILDELYANALVLDDGTNRVALTVCDLIGLRIEIVNDIRDIIFEQTGIAHDNIMITCIHNHCGPNLKAAQQSYVETLKYNIAGAVTAACNSLKPARVGVNSAECRIGANRRNPDSPSGPYALYNWPEGVIDPTVMVMRIEDADSAVMGVLTNYACHPVVLGPRELLISKDYPEPALHVLRKAFGDDIVAIFLQGCCGNINPNWTWDKPHVSPPPKRMYPMDLEPRLAEMRRLGRVLGGTSLKALEEITEFMDEAVIKAVRKDVKLPVRKDIPKGFLKRIEEIKETDESLGTTDYTSGLRAVAQGKKSIVSEVQVIAVGPYLIVGLPSEVFVEYQIQIRQRAGTACTFVSELANDTCSYIPTPEAYDEGGYEPGASYLIPGAGRILVDTALELVKQLQ